jgi:hypothetical protein
METITKSQVCLMLNQKLIIHLSDNTFETGMIKKANTNRT